ncbi:MAG: ABC transporter ATP-binding protein [Propionibacteriaceae bacterium]
MYVSTQMPQHAYPAEGSVAASEPEIVAETRDLFKVYGQGANQVLAVNGVSVSFPRGTFTAIMGPSGSGKSTLMHCLAGLDRISQGSVRLAGVELGTLKDKELTKVRRDKIGFIFQSFNLLPMLTAEQNIVLPVELSGGKVDRELFDRLTTSLGLSERLKHRPSELSGGQQQRVAIARALVSKPDIVFADEPTGALDSKNSHDLLEYLRYCVSSMGQTIVMVTHDPNAAAYADRVLILSDGKITKDLDQPNSDQILAAMKALGEEL